MKNLDLEQMGVQEMNMQETKETDGGFDLNLIIGKIGGVLDGERGNTTWTWFWQL